MYDFIISLPERISIPSHKINLAIPSCISSRRFIYLGPNMEAPPSPLDNDIVRECDHLLNRCYINSSNDKSQMDFYDSQSKILAKCAAIAFGARQRLCHNARLMTEYRESKWPEEAEVRLRKLKGAMDECLKALGSVKGQWSLRWAMSTLEKYTTEFDKATGG
jgi:hypothetical protein